MSLEHDITEIKKRINKPIFKAASPEQAAKRANSEDETNTDKVKRLAQEAQEYFSRVKISPTGDEIVGYVADIIEDDSGYMDEEGYAYIARILGVEI